MIITEIQYFFSKIIRFQAIFKDTVEFTCALEFKISSQLQIVRENILLGLTLYDIKCKTCTTNGVCKPCNGKVEILGKSITWICPWNFGNIYPMFKTDDTMRLVFNFDQNTTPVQPPPSGWSAGMFVISRT